MGEGGRGKAAPPLRETGDSSTTQQDEATQTEERVIRHVPLKGSDRGLRDCEGPQQTGHTEENDTCLDVVLSLCVVGSCT